MQYCHSIIFFLSFFGMLYGQMWELSVTECVCFVCNLFKKKICSHFRIMPLIWFLVLSRLYLWVNGKYNEAKGYNVSINKIWEQVSVYTEVYLRDWYKLNSGTELGFLVVPSPERYTLGTCLEHTVDQKVDKISEYF